MRKILIGICMVFLGVIIMYFNDGFKIIDNDGFKIIDNDGFKIIDEVVKSEDVLPIQNILVEDFVGTIEIKKSNRDNIIKSDNIEIRNINGSLKISNKRQKWFNFGPTNSKVVIEYSNDMLDMDIVDVVGNISIEMPQISNLNIEDVVGDINIKTNGVIDIIDSEDVLGKVSLKNVIKDYNSSQKISVRDLVGYINIF